MNLKTYLISISECKVVYLLFSLINNTVTSNLFLYVVRRLITYKYHNRWHSKNIPVLVMLNLAMPVICVNYDFLRRFRFLAMNF